MGARETVIRLKDDLRFGVRTPSGFDFDIDSAVDPAERLEAPTPMELQLVALGGCSAMDVISVLRKKRQDVVDYLVRVTSTRAPEFPKVYTSITLTHAIRGRGISEANVHRAIELSMTRYCPVFAMLYPTVAISQRYEIVDEATGAVTAGEVLLPEADAAPA